MLKLHLHIKASFTIKVSLIYNSFTYVKKLYLHIKASVIYKNFTCI